jgi:hypothetical protein
MISPCGWLAPWPACAVDPWPGALIENPAATQAAANQQLCDPGRVCCGPRAGTAALVLVLTIPPARSLVFLPGLPFGFSLGLSLGLSLGVLLVFPGGMNVIFPSPNAR